MNDSKCPTPGCKNPEEPKTMAGPFNLETLDARISNLRKIERGWLVGVNINDRDAVGEVPTEAAIEAARNFAIANQDRGFAYLYPTPSGGINVEWDGPWNDGCFLPCGTMEPEYPLDC